MKKITLIIGIVVGILLLFLAFSSFGHQQKRDRIWESYVGVLAF
ncbi:MAG TPA: hypothetical protein VD884_19600 [Ohtaekwangia sp.]|nr:hypothetical protein [Ohtaekwangia sp.]